MIKPLLRILPSLSGNVKLACTLTDVKPVANDNKLWEANIRGARLLPIASQLWQKKIDANLISSTWEYDLPRFYSAYSDVFYKTCFEYNKDDILKIDIHHEQKVRATDFEFGVKRISYSKNGHQFAFFAPIYIDSSDCIPDYFLINITLYNTNAAGETVYAVKKSLRVNIGINGEDRKNYIYRYLYNYAKKLDDNVAFCTPLTNQATYYGVDLIRSGFVTSIDNMMERIYRRQNTIQNFDATICGAFERNRIAMKQIMPLCYYFSVDDILTEPEKVRYRNCKLEFDGAYYDCHGKKINMYDFMHDYMDYAEEILTMNPMTGALQWSAGQESNIMDTIFPSLNDNRYIRYEYANKLAPWFCRWKLKYTDDEHPYVINNSWAFSKNQDSNYRYAQFPSTFHYLQSVANYINIDEKYNYNLMFPVGDINDRNSGRALYAYAPHWKTDSEGNFQEDQFYYIIDRYRLVQENYCANWFSVVNEYNDSIFADETLWKNTEDGCVYYNGILYDLRNVYYLGKSNIPVDKFAVLIQPVVKTFTEADISDLVFSKYTLYRQSVSQIAEPNILANDSLLDFSYIPSKSNYLYENDEFDTGGKVNQDEIRFGEIFKHTDENNGNYIDATNTSYAVILDDGHTTYGRLSLDYYDLNRYYSAFDFDKLQEIINDVTTYEFNRANSELRGMIEQYIEPNYGKLGNIILDKTAYVNNAYLFTPVYRMSDISYTNDSEFTYWKSKEYNVNEEFYNITHNPCIIEIPDSYACREYTYTYDGSTYFTATLFDILAQNSYIRHAADDMTFMGKSVVNGVWNEYAYSYLSVINADYNNSNYGAQHYFLSYLIKSTYIPYLESGFNAYSYLALAYSDQQDDLINHSYLFEWNKMKNDHPASYWAGCLSYWKSYVSKRIYDKVYSECIPEYEYVAVMQDSGSTFAKNVFKERSCWTGHFYGNAIPQSQIDKDIDVLWADPYNFTAIFSYEGKSIPENAVYKDMYVKFLNKLHLFYWYVELFKDEDRTWEGHEDYTYFLQNEWYKYLYVVEKKLVYDYGYNASPQVKLIYTPLEKLLQFPEYYNITDEKTSYTYNVANDPYRSFVAFYNRVQYDPAEDFFTLPGFFNPSMAPYAYLQWECDGSYLGSYLITDATYIGFENEQMSPVIERGEYGHRYEKLTYSYILDDDQNVYGHYEPIKFELVYRKKMYRVDEDLWNITHISDSAEHYRDLYFYRLQSDIEHEIKYYNNSKKIDFISDMSYMRSDLTYIKSYTYIQIEDYEGDVAYNYRTAYYDDYETKHRLTYEPMSYIQQADSMLVPIFDDIFLQPSSESLIYTHYALHDIGTAEVVKDIPNAATGKFDKITSNYRYNKPDKLILVDISQDELNKYMFTDTYEKYDECYAEMTIKDDDLGYGEFGLSTKVMPDGTKYGFYYINSYINNTSNTFNIAGIANGDALSGIKYINYINGVDITKSHEYVTAIYKQLLPFINQQPLNAMSGANTIVYPKTYPIDLIYSQKLYNSNNESKETDIIKNEHVLRTMSLLRYFHAMTPLIVPTNVIQNEWRLKLKDVNAQMLDTGKYLSIGDAPIYSETVHINKYEPYRVYSPSNNQIEIKNYNNFTWAYTPLEYKFYNDSAAINLEPHFEIKVQGKMTYDELLSKETHEFVFNLFQKRLNGKVKKKYDDDQILFLLNKYVISYDSVPVGLNMQHTEKLYTLTIVFDLL